MRERAVKSVNAMTPEMTQDLDTVLNRFYCRKYDKMFNSFVDKTLHRWKANHDEAPPLVADPNLLKIKILEAASAFNITGDIDLDHGYSYSY